LENLDFIKNCIPFWGRGKNSTMEISVRKSLAKKSKIKLETGTSANKTLKEIIFYFFLIKFSPIPVFFSPVTKERKKLKAVSMQQATVGWKLRFLACIFLGTTFHSYPLSIAN
jgi:hypothetical protein